MDIFIPTLNQMGLLFLFIIIGYILAKWKFIPENSASVLSKLENFVLIPASVLATFMRQFTVSNLKTSGLFFAVGFATILISIPIAMLVARICSKDSYIRKIYTYGIAFSNFGFMGYAVVKGVFPSVYSNYLVFVIPFWMLIYVWGVPSLLIPKEEGSKKSFASRFKAFLNPMFIAMIVGMVVGLLFSNQIVALESSGTKIFVFDAIDKLDACMSPVAMLLTGMTIAKIDLKRTFTKLSLYIISLFRLFLIPLVFIAVLIFIPMNHMLKICILCVASMPLGLNTIVIPSSYGLDTSEASGMALISHLLSCISIPVIFMLFNLLVK
ncbi:MAG: AEC family transporter [Clostridia bacterium]|nr:AEC family transporter [Clostridia bacterium]